MKNSIWTFCVVCKKIEKKRVGRLYNMFGIPPSHLHGLGVIGLNCFNTRQEAREFKKNFKEIVFGR